MSDATIFPFDRLLPGDLIELQVGSSTPPVRIEVLSNDDLFAPVVTLIPPDAEKREVGQLIGCLESPSKMSSAVQRFRGPVLFSSGSGLVIILYDEGNDFTALVTPSYGKACIIRRSDVIFGTLQS